MEASQNHNYKVLRPICYCIPVSFIHVEKCSRKMEKRNITMGWNHLCYQCVSSFQNDPFGYKPHEEQYLDNPHDVVLFNYNALIPKTYFPIISTTTPPGQVSSKTIIATYELNYKKGRVITLGIYSDDVVNDNKFDSYFDKLLLKQGITDICRLYGITS